jgi:hypothetical protein
LAAADFFSLNDASRVLKEDRNLITFLVRDRQIPVRMIGRSKVLDMKGLKRLRLALSEYRGKPESVSA